MKAQKLMVVVRYDLYPHMLVFDVASIEPAGRVRVKDVGTYDKDAVLAIVPKEEGEKIKSRLSAIKGEVDLIHTRACEERKAALYKDFPAIRRTK
jgi:hypothetical protein